MDNVDILSKLDGNILSWHGVPNHQSWWYYERQYNYSVQTRGGIIVNYDYNDTVVTAYVRIQSKDMTYYWNEFMKYIGGHSHAQCR